MFTKTKIVFFTLFCLKIVTNEKKKRLSLLRYVGKGYRFSNGVHVYVHKV